MHDRTIYRFSWRRVAIIAGVTVFSGLAWIAVGYAAAWRCIDVGLPPHARADRHAGARCAAAWIW